MAGSIGELITRLVESERAMEEMTQALAEEQRCIVGMDLPRLHENEGRKEQATAGLARLQGLCSELIRRAGTELGHREIHNLSALIAVVAPVQQTELQPVQQRQVRLATALERQFGLNRTLLMNSIGMIQKSMTQFGRLLGGCDTYGVQGRIHNGRTTGTVLCREL